MTATVSELKHLFMHRRKDQTLLFEVEGVKFVIRMGNIDITRRNATLDIIAPPNVKITRGELLTEGCENVG